MKFNFMAGAILVTTLSVSACNSSGDLASGSNPSGIPASLLGGTGAVAVGTSPQTPPAAVQRSYTTQVMLFSGGGTWAAEVANLEALFTAHGASYKSVSSADMNAMTVDEIAQFGVLVFPGGAGGTEADSLTAQTHANLREAVQLKGVSYLGFCAGSFIAVAPTPASGKDVSYGLGIVDGPVLNYYLLENQGIDIQMTLQSFPDGSTQDILWYGGPVTPNTSGGVVAKYPDGNPSISEMWSGSGFVILSGGHPTATAATLAGLGMTSSDGAHTDTAWNLVNAALTQTPLPAF